MPTLKEIEGFLKSYLKGKSEITKKQADIALTHWENDIRQKLSSQVKKNDIDMFVFRKKEHLKPNSLVVYLFHIGKYFAWSERKDLEKYVMRIRKRIRKKLKTKETVESIDHNDILEMLMEVAELQGKLWIRLLLFSEIPIGCLKNLKVRHIFDKNKYQIPCKGKMINGVLHSDTPEIINKYIEEEKLKENDEIIDISIRKFQYLIPKYARRVGINKAVTPKDLRKIGKDSFKREWLSEVYVKAKKGRISEVK